MRYIPCLTGLRAFAIGLVLLEHLFRVPNIPLLFRENPLEGLGGIGVRFFFVLSGYLITHLLIQEHLISGRVSISKFFVRRVIRIFPNWYFYLLVLAVLKWIGVLHISQEAIFYGLFYIQNFNVFQLSEMFATSWLVKHSWSLSVEEQFYIIFPFIFKNIKTIIMRNPIVVALAVLCLSSFYRGINYSYPELSRGLLGPFLMHVDYLVCGACIACVLPAYKEIIKKNLEPYRNYILLMFIPSMLILAQFEYHNGLLILFSGGVTLLTNVYILVYFLIFPEGVLGRFFETRPLKFIGKLSYSLYVWQQLFLGSTGLWISSEFVTYFPLNLCLVMICALTSYYIIERPFLRLKKKFATM